jgi:uncharacterized protein (TIGR03067 family)
MKRHLVAVGGVAVVSAVLLVLSAAAEDPSVRERAKLQGTWEGWVVNGKGENPNSGPVKLAEVVITADRIRARQGDGKDLGEGSYRMDPTQTPKVLDSTGVAGEVRGMSFRGIYALEGETLWWCSSNPGKPRPTEFRTRPSDGQFLMVLKRR